ncbi:hypothetical protein M413DRAFT_302302 [Hebeloma cylindrosporum]|uniref:Uncharacterized protein n=1 Tax=Hebeloma cylindrosporum TaxID=76867 RepID=A0A0C3CPN6_HEBCY|nr:hypothetical protein M413DRAFT_302302 [Hebeloma cylindrosporum h7]
MKTPRPASPDGTEECRRVPFVNKCASPLMRLSSISFQGSGSDMVDGVAGTWVEQPTIQNSSCKVTGWDSDLTELNDSEDEAESRDGSSEPEMNDDAPPTAPSGLKIRIPARPAGAYSTKCASPKCHQLLSVGYRWKSCVLCRARSRDYQRRRQNLQGKHLRLDEELLDAENAGTPLAGVCEFHIAKYHLVDLSYRTSLPGLQNRSKLRSDWSLAHDSARFVTARISFLQRMNTIGKCVGFVAFAAGR